MAHQTTLREHREKYWCS